MFPKKGIEKTKTHVLYSISIFSENRAVYEIMWKYSVKPDRPHMTIWRMRFACRMTKAADTHSKYVIFIAFPLQKWLHERASMLRYTCTACLVHNLTASLLPNSATYTHQQGHYQYMQPHHH
jgi:hypothetical protein